MPAQLDKPTGRHRASRHRAKRQRPRVAPAGAALLVVLAVALVMRIEPVAHAGSIPTASAELDAVAADALSRPAAPEVNRGSPESKARAVRPRSSRSTKRKPPARKPKARKPLWMRPVGGSITSGYGWRWGRMHRGLDFAGSYGAPIYAASDGVISFAGPKGGYGNLIVIDHGDGVQTAYGHMSSIVVASGKVRAGQLIARIGSEGYSTGPHLHLEVRVNEVQVNPWGFLLARGVRL